MNSGWTYCDRVDAASNGCTVLDYYTQRYRHSSRAEWQERIDHGQILLDDHSTTAQTRLQKGQQLTYRRLPWQEPTVPLNVEVLYDDSDLMVVVKPAGLPVLPGGGFLEHTLLWQLQQRFPDKTPTPIHRLGRGTSGLLLLARSPSGRAHLSQQLRDRQIQKIYRTLVCGTSMPDRFTVEQSIGRQSHPILGHLYVSTADGLPAYSECQVLRRNAATSLLDVRILTGRPHQIRIHLASAGYPLVGDPLYTVGGQAISLTPSETGELPVPGDCGYHLHAMHLHVAHPNGQPLSFTCPPPTELSV